MLLLWLQWERDRRVGGKEGRKKYRKNKEELHLQREEGRKNERKWVKGTWGVEETTKERERGKGGLT